MDSNKFEFYKNHSAITDLGHYGRYVPNTTDITHLMRIVKNLLVHFQNNSSFSDIHAVKIHPRHNEIYIRKAYDMLNKLESMLSYPLDLYKESETKLVSNCRGFAVILCSFLRENNIPARVRYVFSNIGYQDRLPITAHAVVDYLNNGKWKIADARLEYLEKSINIKKSDIPRSKIFFPKELWKLWRKNDLHNFNFFSQKESIHISKIIRNTFLYDLASLSGYEPLFFDRWGVMNQENPFNELTNPMQIEFWDEMSTLDEYNINDYKKIKNILSNNSDISFYNEISTFNIFDNTMNFFYLPRGGIRKPMNRDILLEKLSVILKNELGLIEDIDPNASLQDDLAMDSMSLLIFMMALEENIDGFVVDANTLVSDDVRNLNSICNYVMNMISK